MAEISVRLTEAARDNLDRICGEQGISGRAALEAIFLCFLGECPGAKRIRAITWSVAARIDAEAAKGTSPRVKFNTRIEDEILERARVACEKHGVSVNGLAATAVTPWGSGWGDKADYEARAKIFERAVTVARRLDYERRTGRPVTLEC